MEKELTIKTTEETWPDALSITESANNIIRRAGDAPHLEEIIKSSAKSFYLIIPGGAENYSGTSPKLGKVELVPRAYSTSNGEIDIMFTPSPEYKKRWGSESKTIGNINIRDKEYNTEWGERLDEDYFHIPKQVMEDTDNVMEMMGLYNPAKAPPF